MIRAIDGPLANVAGVQPEDTSYAPSAAALRQTWVALRVAMRSVLEHVTIADIASGALPDDVAHLVGDSEAWVTRPFGDEVEPAGRSGRPGWHRGPLRGTAALDGPGSSRAPTCVR